MKLNPNWLVLLLLNAAATFAQSNWEPPKGWTAVQPLNLKLDGFHLAGAWKEQKSGVGVLMMAMPAIKSDTEVRDAVAGWVSGNLREGLFPVNLGYFKMGVLHGFRASGPYAGADDDYWLDSYVFVGVEGSFGLKIFRRNKEDVFDLEPWLVDIVPNLESMARLKLLEQQLNSSLPKLQEQAAALQKIVRAKRAAAAK